MTKRTRLKITVFFGLIITLLAFYCTNKGLENAVIACVSAICVNILSYINNETKRPSEK